MKSSGIILTVLVLVGVPLGVFIVGRATAPTHHVSRLGVVAEQLTVNLEKNGVTNVQCDWTGSGSGPTVLTCSGTVGSSSFDSLRESDSATVNVPPPGS
jgi:hypothetical protein